MGGVVNVGSTVANMVLIGLITILCIAHPSGGRFGRTCAAPLCLGTTHFSTPAIMSDYLFMCAHHECALRLSVSLHLGELSELPRRLSASIVLCINVH